MREEQESRPVARIVFAPQRLDGAFVSEVDTPAEGGASQVVIDLSETAEIDDDVIPLLDWLALRLENAGGSLSVAARQERGAHTTRTLRGGDLNRVLGVHAALDRAILRQLLNRAGGAALW